MSIQDLIKANPIDNKKDSSKDPHANKPSSLLTANLLLKPGSSLSFLNKNLNKKCTIKYTQKRTTIPVTLEIFTSYFSPINKKLTYKKTKKRLRTIKEQVNFDKVSENPSFENRLK